MQQYTSHLINEAATEALGRCLARCLVPGLVITLQGELGSGKTALTRAMLHAAGVDGHIKSPTYTLAEPYQIVLNGRSVTVMHFDLYRMSSPQEFLEAGLRELFNGSTICVIEWPEMGQDVLPVPDIEILLTVAGSGREVKCRALTEQGSACLNQLNFAPNL